VWPRTLCHPEYVVFVDEVGCNTSQEGVRAHVKESASTNEDHSTILGCLVECTLVGQRDIVSIVEK